MKQIFILGASSVYGVGAEHDGWGDLVKSYVHTKLYSADGFGEAAEVFNFAKAGCTIEFVADNLDWIRQNYARSQDVLVLITVGGNDARAVDSPDNFVSTPEDFQMKLETLTERLLRTSKQVVFVCNSYVDESKVNPKSNPFGSGHVSYFTNSRRALFNDVVQQVCDVKGLPCVVVDTTEA